MRKSLLRCSVALFAVAAATSPSKALDAGCPGNIVLPGNIACHSGGSDCKKCKYTCDNGTTPEYNMCGET